MISLSQLTNQPTYVRVGFFVFKLMPLSLNEFYGALPKDPPPLEVLLRCVVKKDELSWVLLKEAVDPKGIWTRTVLILALRKTYKFPLFLLAVLTEIIFNSNLHVYLFKVISEQNGLISYFDSSAANDEQSENKLSQKKVLEGYLLNFSLIRQLFGGRLNGKTLDASNFYDVINYPQFHFFLYSGVLAQGLAQHNAQLNYDEDNDKKTQDHFLEARYHEFIKTMKACFPGVPEENYFKPEIERRFRSGMGKRKQALYDLFKGALENDTSTEKNRFKYLYKSRLE